MTRGRMPGARPAGRMYVGAAEGRYLEFNLAVRSEADRAIAMASKAGDVLERRREKQYMDDTAPLTASVVNYRTLPSHVVGSAAKIESGHLA